jgi:hypothetical protein
VVAEIKPSNCGIIGNWAVIKNYQSPITNHQSPNHKKIAERHGSHLALDSGGSANGEFIRLNIYP